MARYSTVFSGSTDVGSGNLAAGTYQIVPSGVVLTEEDGVNYNVVYENGTLTVGEHLGTPVVTVINNCDGTSTLSTTATGDLLWSTNETTPSITVNAAGEYTVTTTVDGCTSEAGSGTAAPKITPLAPVVTVVNNCDGTSTLSTTATGDLLWSTNETTPSITVNAAGEYTVTTTVDGCTSAEGSGTAAPKTTPLAPVVTVVNNCDGTSTLSTLATGDLLWSTGETTSAITVNIADDYTVTTTVDGCTSAEGSGTAAPKTTPLAPVVTVVNNCGTSTLSTTATGSLLWSTGETGASIIVSVADDYSVTVTADGCISGTGSATAAPKEIPLAPVVTVVNNCGSSVLSTTAQGLLQWNTGQATVSITVINADTYTVTTTLDGCMSGAGAGIAAPGEIPSTPILGTITQPACDLATGSVVLSNLPSGTWTLTRTLAGPNTTTTTNGNTTSTTVSGLAAGTYTFTVTNSMTCTSLSTGNVVISTQPATPLKPEVGTITPPTCTLATGSVILSNLPSGTWTVTSTPSTFTTTGNTTTATISGIPAGNYVFKATNSDGCISPASGSVQINAQPATPTVPTVGTITQPACTLATGSVALSGLPSGTWTLRRTLGSTTTTTTGSSTSTTVSGLAAGTYTFTVTNSVGCTSATTGNVVINTQPVTPSAPTAGTRTHPTCTVATGSVVLSGLPSGAWTLTRTPGNVTTTGNTSTATVSGIPAGTYTFKVTNAAGCTSVASANVVINAQPAIPAAPTASVTQPTCTTSTGTITVTSSKSGLSFILNGTTTNTTGVFTGVAPGTHTLTARNSVGCISAPTTVVVTANVNCSSIGDIVFKDANANGIKEGSESGIASVVVRLLNSGGTQIASTTTNSNGAYSFSSLAPGTYSVVFTTPSGYYPTASNVGSDDTRDSDPVNGTVSVTLALNQTNNTVDAGFIQSVLVLGNRVWYDTDNNGINSSSENGIRNIAVKLYRDNDNNNVADGTAIATATTDATGYYKFTSLAPGNYIVGVVIPAGYISSAVNGSDPDNNNATDDNGSVLVGNEIRGLAITLSMNAEPDGSSSNTNTNNSYDFGLLPDCGCINTSGNLLTNGNFENGATGWSASGGTVTTGAGYVACGSKNGFNNASSKSSLVYQDVNIASGTTVTFSGFAGTHTPGLSCSPKLSLIFRNSSGTVLAQTDVAVTRDVDVYSNQLAYYSITATAPVGTAKVRVQSSIGCNYMKLDGLCLRTGSNLSARPGSPVITSTDSPVFEFDVAVAPNPSYNYFDAAISSDDNTTPVQIRISSSDGRQVSVQKTTPNTTLKIDASKWKGGVYFVEVMQGNKRKVVKLVKL